MRHWCVCYSRSQTWLILIVKNEFQIMVADRMVDDEVETFTRIFFAERI